MEIGTAISDLVSGSKGFGNQFGSCKTSGTRTVTLVLAARPTKPLSLGILWPLASKVCPASPVPPAMTRYSRAANLLFENQLAPRNIHGRRRQIEVAAA